MQSLGRRRIRLRTSNVLGLAGAAVVFVAALCQSGVVEAAPHGGGGGGFHGGGFHGGGFHGGGFHGGGFHGGGVHGNGFGGFHGGGFHDRRFGGFRGGFGVLGWPYYTYPYEWGYYPDSGYDWGHYGNSQTWYYCSDPAGYYPYVTQCNTGWQAVPAS
jgi:hypothetical protein